MSQIRNTVDMRTALLIFSISTFLMAQGATRISKEEYVNTWRSIAISQMIDHKIPASITLAQGILESGSGNSDLAQKGNNHFGIKCHGWAGEKMFVDDDQKNECFRMYSKAEESYIDHSVFLEKPRYAALFQLEPEDYKGWAKGLKAAGYATNPKYPDLLIEIIEGLKLNELDVLGAPEVKPTLVAAGKSELTIKTTQHEVNIHANKVNYIIAKKGDTYYRIAKEFNMGLWQLYRYNDFGARKDVLEEGDIIYLQPKRKRAKEKDAVLQVTSPISMREISQKEAIKLSSLLKMNDCTNPDLKLTLGERVVLR